MNASKENLSNCKNFLTLHEFYKCAKKNTLKETWDYIIGASETETTYKRNRYSLDSYAFRPRVLRNVEILNTQVNIFGNKLNMPVFFAPIGSMQDFVEGGALCSTISASNNKILHMLSSTWSGGIDIIGKATDYPKIYQLYIRGDENWIDDQVQKAIDNGFIALCLTIDLDAAKKYCQERNWKWTLDLIDKYQKEMEELKEENVKFKRQLYFRYLPH